MWQKARSAIFKKGSAHGASADDTTPQRDNSDDDFDPDAPDDDDDDSGDSEDDSVLELDETEAVVAYMELDL